MLEAKNQFEGSLLLEEIKTSDSAPEISPEEVSAFVRAALVGDDAAFAQLIRWIEPRLQRHALYLTGQEQQAFDLLQETVLQTWKHLGRYDQRASFFTWVCSIMLHRHYDWLRRMRTRAFALFAGSPDDTLPHDGPTPSESATHLDEARVIRECLDHLPAAQRMVVYLRFYAGETLEGIAATAGCSVGTVKSRLFHALKRLAEMRKLKELRRSQEG